MIQPSSRVTRNTPMNPAMSGQYMFGTLHAGVQRYLLAGRWERPGDLEAALLTKHELELAGWAQTVGMVGPVGRARAGVRHRTEQVLAEEAVLTADPHRPRAAVRHARSLLKKFDLVGRHQSRLLPPGATPNSGNRKNFTSSEIPANSGNFRARRQTWRKFRSFPAAVWSRSARVVPNRPEALSEAARGSTGR